MWEAREQSRLGANLVTKQGSELGACPPPCLAMFRRGAGVAGDPSLRWPRSEPVLRVSGEGLWSAWAGSAQRSAGAASAPSWG